MLLKKSILIGSAIALLSLPVIASANLNTTNSTDEDSAVKVTNGHFNSCSTAVPGGAYTPHRGSSSVEAWKVKVICEKPLGGGKCEADIYMSQNCANGTQIAHAILNVDSLTIDSVQPFTSDYAARYNVKWTQGASSLEICYKGNC